MNLLIVESPNKIAKITSILGNGWEVVATAGHFRDLPRHKFGIDQNFALVYEFTPPVTRDGKTYSGGEERISRIRAKAAKATNIYLATDPDREGEAIAWHLATVLQLKNPKRVAFAEITPAAIRQSLNNVRAIDMNLVRAQEARRALDRVVGYVVSPLITAANPDGSTYTAGRVQSPAIRLIIERENKIRSFKKVAHYGVELGFDAADGEWSALWDTKSHVSPDDPYVTDKGLADEAASQKILTVVNAEKTLAHRAPPAPFSTSLLLQAASVSLKFKPEQTTKLAQTLFEAGAITYIRTDSTNFADDAINEIRQYATSHNYDLPEKPRKFRSKQNAQEAHEAIRPTHIEHKEAGETPDEKALYRLIWNRSLASQLADAEYSVISVTLESADKKFTYKASARALTKKGWTALTAKDAASEEDENDTNNGKVPLLTQGEQVTPARAKVLNKETRPSSRFTQASLIAALEKEGIGRPSTYPTILANLFGRAYVVEDRNFLHPTSRGQTLYKSLMDGAFSFFSVTYTKQLEDQLDAIAAADMTYLEVVEPAATAIADESKLLKRTYSERGSINLCPNCKEPLRRFAQKDASGKPTRSFAWVCTSDSCGSYYEDENGKPVEIAKHNCPKCSSELKRFKNKTGGGHAWVCTSENCKTFYDDNDGNPVERAKPVIAENACVKCSSDLRRFKKKAGGHGWVCTSDECKTFYDDDDGKPVEQAKRVYPKTPCPKCSSDLKRFKRKAGDGYAWVCTSDKCNTFYDDKNGKPVPQKPKEKR